MKKILILLSLVLVFASCSKDEDDSNSVNSTTSPLETKSSTPTSVEFTIKNELGNAVPGANVSLFSSQSDWENNVNKRYTTTADAQGKCTISNLSTLRYYWYVESGCLNNYNNANTTTTLLKENSINQIFVIVSPTGTIKLINNSNNSYRVYLNDSNCCDMLGKTTKYLSHKTIGAYIVKVVQLDGYLFYPTEKIYNSNLSSGDTLTVSFP